MNITQISTTNNSQDNIAQGLAVSLEPAETVVQKIKKSVSK